nr:hypothetical protein [Nonomuraea cypriaca]
MTTEIVMLIIGVLVAEGTEVAPWLAKRLACWSTKLRYTDPKRAVIRAEELAAVIDARPGKLFKLITALLFVAQGCLAWGHRIGQRAWKRAITSDRIIHVVLRRQPKPISAENRRRLQGEGSRNRVDYRLIHTDSTTCRRSSLELARTR